MVTPGTFVATLLSLEACLGEDARQRDGALRLLRQLCPLLWRRQRAHLPLRRWRRRQCTCPWYINKVGRSLGQIVPAWSLVYAGQLFLGDLWKFGGWHKRFHGVFGPAAAFRGWHRCQFPVASALHLNGPIDQVMWHWDGQCGVHLLCKRGTRERKRKTSFELFKNR